MASRPLVFLIHGMGKHDGTWAEGFVSTLDKCIVKHKYRNLVGRKISELVEFVPIVYDNYFEDTTAAWKKNSAAILEQASPAEKEIFESAVDWAAGLDPQSKAEEFAWTHAVDVLLWRAHPLIRNAVKTQVADRITGSIVKRLKDNPADLLNTSIVSHSLGTSVCKHVLEDLSRGGWSMGRTGFDPTFFHFTSLHTVANICALLDFPGYYGAYAGFVKPGPSGDPDSYCKYFACYANQFDPFAVVRPFEPPQWNHDMFDVKRVNHVHDLNVHALEHYALHPLVHITMFRSWLGYHTVPAEEEITAISNFATIGPKITKAAQNRLKELVSRSSGAIGSTPDLVDVLKGITLFYREVKP